MHCVKLAFCWLLLLSAPALGQVANIGDAQGLDTLKRMQGRWNIACQSSGQGAYAVSLVVSFTHFRLNTREYYDPECLRLRASRHGEYRFVLGESLSTPDGSSAFAIDFQQESFEAGAYWLAPFNLIRVHRGRLFLAEPNHQDTQTRPEALDYTRPFVR